MSETKQEEQWDLVIAPPRGWFDLHLRDLWRYRDLVALFVRRDFVAVYKQTILGPLWHIIQPLLTTIMFTVVFGGIAGLPTDGVPLFIFYMAGTTVWTYFASCLTRTSNTFTANASMFGKVYFPRMAVPVSAVVSQLIAFGIQFGFFLLVYVFFLNNPAIQPNAAILLLPLLLVLMAGLGLGFGIIISSMTTKYRDLQVLVAFGVQLWMYATPVIFPLSNVLEKSYRWVFLVNPMSGIVEAFRYGFFGQGVLSYGLLAYSTVFTIVLLLAGLVIFNRIERTFMDTV